MKELKLDIVEFDKFDIIKLKIYLLNWVIKKDN